MIRVLDCFLLRTPKWELERFDCIYVWETDYLLTDKEFLELISYSSDSLTEEIKYRHNSSKTKKVLTTLRKYYTRICTRATPFGMLSTYSIGRKRGNISKIILDKDVKVLYSFDAEFISNITKELINSDKFKWHSLFYTNPSLHKVGRNFHYIEYFKDREKYLFTKLDYSRLLDKVLKIAIKGVSLQSLYSLMEDKLSKNEINLVIDFLINSQLIVSEFECVFFTEDHIAKMYSIALKLQSEFEDNLVVKLFLYLYQEFDRIKEFKSINLANELAKKYITNFKLKKDISQRFFTINVKRKIKGEGLSNDIFEQLLDVVKFYQKICYVESKKDHNIYKFKEAFIDRYGIGTKIPLLGVLNPIIGLGYPFNDSIRKSSEIIKNIELPVMQNNQSDQKFSLLELLISKKMKEDALEVVLDDKDFEGVDGNDTIYFPKSFCISTEIMENNDHSNIIYIKGIGGKTAIEPLVRYERQDDEVKEIIATLSDHEHKSISSQYVLADIVYATDSKIDNLIVHSPIREYEIILKTNTTNLDEKKIFISDVYLTVDGNKIKLWSNSLKKYIIPINSTVHNYAKSDSTCYNFLSDYMKEFFDQPVLPLSPIFKYYDFVPRIRYNNCVFLPACWSLTLEEFKWLRSLDIDNDEFFIEKITEWRRKRNIPDKVVYMHTDLCLLIDFEIKRSIGLLLSTAKETKKIWLFEFLYNTFESIVVDEDNRHYTNEFIFFAIN